MKRSERRKARKQLKNIKLTTIPNTSQQKLCQAFQRARTRRLRLWVRSSTLAHAAFLISSPSTWTFINVRCSSSISPSKPSEPRNCLILPLNELFEAFSLSLWNWVRTLNECIRSNIDYSKKHKFPIYVEACSVVCSFVDCFSFFFFTRQDQMFFVVSSFVHSTEEEKSSRDDHSRLINSLLLMSWNETSLINNFYISAITVTKFCRKQTLNRPSIDQKNCSFWKGEILSCIKAWILNGISFYYCETTRESEKQESYEMKNILISFSG